MYKAQSEQSVVFRMGGAPSSSKLTTLHLQKKLSNNLHLSGPTHIYLKPGCSPANFSFTKYLRTKYPHP